MGVVTEICIKYPGGPTRIAVTDVCCMRARIALVRLCALLLLYYACCIIPALRIILYRLKYRADVCGCGLVPRLSPKKHCLASPFRYE
jgi:hypothetical protein